MTETDGLWRIPILAAGRPFRPALAATTLTSPNDSGTRVSAYFAAFDALPIPRAVQVKLMRESYESRQ